MQCSGIILRITTDLHLLLILHCQVRPIATRSDVRTGWRKRIIVDWYDEITVPVQ